MWTTPMTQVAAALKLTFSAMSHSHGTPARILRKKTLMSTLIRTLLVATTSASTLIHACQPHKTVGLMQRLCQSPQTNYLAYLCKSRQVCEHMTITSSLNLAFVLLIQRLSCSSCTNRHLSRRHLSRALPLQYEQVVVALTLQNVWSR